MARVLVACEFSGIVRDAFAALGHDAWSCDLLESEKPGKHFCQSIESVLENHRRLYWKEPWDLMIAHPPCTHLAVSGARWFKEKQKEQAEALNFVRALLDAPIEHIALENPVSIISSRIRKPDQIIQPWMFGHGETKATCLWLKNLPKLTPTQIVTPEWAKNPDGTDYRDSKGKRYSPTHYFSGRMQKASQQETLFSDARQEQLRKWNRVHYASPGPDRWKERSRTIPGIAKAMAEQWGPLL